MYVSCSSFSQKSFKMRKAAFLFLLVIAMACDKERNAPIPYVFVDFTIDLNGPSSSDLVGIQGFIIRPNDGVKGIIVYHQGVDDYVAFDRSCPYQTNDACALISVDNSNRSIAVDSCCESKFFISNGNRIQGPASAPLRYYLVTLSGNLLHVTN